VARKQHSPESVLSMLKQAETDLAGGMTVRQACQKLGISEQTFYRWRSRFGGMKAEAVARLAQLEFETVRLKKLLGQEVLENYVLREKLEDLQNCLRHRRAAENGRPNEATPSRGKSRNKSQSPAGLPGL